MKRNLITLLIGFSLLATPVAAKTNFDKFMEWLGSEEPVEESIDEPILGRATAVYSRSILPEVTDIYDIGTSTLEYNGVFNDIIINGSCTGSGCSSGSGDPFAWDSTTNYGALANSTSTPLWVR